MTEELITYETAVLLKSKGFTVPCYEFYLVSTEKLYEDGDIFEKTNHNEFPDVVSAPKQSVVQKWLREVHKIDVVVLPWKDHAADPGDKHSYRPMIYNVKTFGEYSTYEKALEIGILESLKLIK